MSIIALFFPACISMIIRHKRNDNLHWHPVECLLEYAVLTIINVFLTEAVIVYVFKITAEITAFESFTFFTKFLLVAVVIAFLMPYVEEIVSKYIKVSFSVEENKKE